MKPCSFLVPYVRGMDTISQGYLFLSLRSWSLERGQSHEHLHQRLEIWSFLKTSRSAEFFLERTLAISNLNTQLLEYGRVILLWPMLNVLCTFRCTGAMSDRLKKKGRVRPTLLLKCWYHYCIEYSIMTTLASVLNLGTDIHCPLHFTKPLLQIFSVLSNLALYQMLDYSLHLTNWR